MKLSASCSWRNNLSIMVNRKFLKQSQKYKSIISNKQWVTIHLLVCLVGLENLSKFASPDLIRNILCSHKRPKYGCAIGPIQFLLGLIFICSCTTWIIGLFGRSSVYIGNILNVFDLVERRADQPQRPKSISAFCYLIFITCYVIIFLIIISLFQFILKYLLASFLFIFMN